MRDETIIHGFQNLQKMIAHLAQGMQLSQSGEAIGNQALRDLLIEKGLITEVELTQQIGKTIAKINTQIEAEQAKKASELIKPTTEQVQAVEQTKSVDLSAPEPQVITPAPEPAPEITTESK
jgi:hypothetical protein